MAARGGGSGKGKEETRMRPATHTGSVCGIGQRDRDRSAGSRVGQRAQSAGSGSVSGIQGRCAGWITHRFHLKDDAVDRDSLDLSLGELGSEGGGEFKTSSAGRVRGVRTCHGGMAKMA